MATKSVEQLRADLTRCLGDYFEHDAGELLEPLDVAELKPLVRPLIAFMQEHPDEDLGSPGPIVHVLERLEVDSYLPDLLDSLATAATMYTIWLAERLLNRPEPGPEKAQILAAFRSLVASDSIDEDHTSQIKEALARHD